MPINLCKANKGLSDKISEISKQLKEIKIATQSQVAACAKEIKSHRDDAKKSWADVTKMNIESSQTILSVQKEVKSNSNVGQIKLNAKGRSIIYQRVKRTIPLAEKRTIKNLSKHLWKKV